MEIPASWRLKLERAREHVKSFDAELAAFVQRERHGVNFTFEPDPEPTYHIGRVTTVPAIPIEFGLLIGDAIHNYRSALDHLMWALCWKCLGTEPWQRTQFPIATTEAAWQSWSKAWSQLSPELVAQVDWFQPYYRPNPDNMILSWLARLDNEDKHRTIRPTLFATKDIALFPEPGFPVAGEAQLTLGGPLKVGAQIARVRVLGPAKQKVEMYGQVSAEVAFDNGIPIEEFFDWVDQAVREVIELFEPYL
jgi:hypothetical protein